MGLFTDHPNQVGETYFEHAWYATRNSLFLILLAMVGFIHAIFPFIMPFFVVKNLIHLGERLKDRARKANERY